MMARTERLKSPRKVGSFLTHAQLALGMAIFGSATPVSKIVTSAMPVFFGAGIRVLIGISVLLPFAWRRRAQIGELGRREWLIVVAIALFGMFGFTALMLYGMRVVSGVVGAIVMSTTPAVTAAASMIFLRDKPTWRKLTAISLAIVGILVLQLDSGESTDDKDGDAALLGGALVFGAVCCEAAYTLLGKLVSEKFDPVLVAFLAAACSLPLFVPFALWQMTGMNWSTIDSGAWIALIWYGAGTLALGSWLWYSGIAKAEGSIAAGFMAIMPVSALLLSYVLLGEPFRAIHLTGFAIVLAGVLLISSEHARMAKSE